MKNGWECYNAFKENGKTYRYGDNITNAEYEKISDKKWFFKKEEVEDTCNRCGDKYADILGIGCCPKCFYK